MKVLVTGANGFLGLGIVEKLLDSGIEVVATDFKIDLVDNRAKKFHVTYLVLKTHMNFLINQTLFCT
ncbi:NAD-dependent epimerase/dehydratase family protein [Streptococcus uberis]|uniref:NAD-dependent epimerase/dehydratase family protein n=1 Tax=Streptococcus uberis TaxID=1349 RepID=UPI0027DD2108|nr:NAD-dependent epimerase/dehydratase family protein [Streptococcus uberis]